MNRMAAGHPKKLLFGRGFGFGLVDFLDVAFGVLVEIL